MTEVFLTQLGSSALEIILLAGAVRWVSQRVDKLEAMLQNGLRSEIQDTRIDVAAIKGKLGIE